MNLYVYTPGGHGSQTYAVVGATEQEAFGLIDSHLRKHYFKDGQFTYYASGWGTDYYALEVLPVGQVFEHPNE